MGIVLGYLCLICFLLLGGKLITKRFHAIKLDRVLMKLHKPVSAIMLILCVLHIFYVIPVMRNRSIAVSLTGMIAMLVVVLLIVLCHIMKEKKTRMQWHRILSVAIAVLVVGHIVTYFIDFGNYQHRISSIEIENRNLCEIEDGSYEGEYDAGYIYAKVKVDIKDGRIEAITLLEHRHERGEAAEIISKKVMEEQRLDVDAVSGATNSSKVIKKAVENALVQGD